MRPGAASSDAGETPARVRLLSLVELQPRSHVGGLLRVTGLRVAADELVQDAHCLGIVAAAGAVAGEEQPRGSSHARCPVLPSRGQRGSGLAAPSVGGQRAGENELRVGRVAAAQRLHCRLGLRDRGAGLAGGKQPLGPQEQLAPAWRR